VRALASTLALLALISCGSDQPSTEGGDSELAGLTLLEDEAPEGLELRASGSVGSVREVLPPRSAAPQLPPLSTELRRSFVDGYDAVYGGDPTEGPTSATSSVLRFNDGAGAALFLGYLREVQTGEVTLGSSRQDIELLEAPTLGEEGYAWHRVLPGGEASGCSWRREELVFTLTLGGPLGRAPGASALELARTLDSRLD
jgi:hypothetical protein